jgi:hypothetical protein
VKLILKLFEYGFKEVCDADGIYKGTVALVTNSLTVYAIAWWENAVFVELVDATNSWNCAFAI